MSDELHRFPPLVATHADHLRAQLAAEGERADKAEAKADRLLRDVTREASRRVLAETERDNQRDRADRAEADAAREAELAGRAFNLEVDLRLAAEAERDAARARLAEAEALLRSFVEDDNYGESYCFHDHDGNCQAHFGGNPCPWAEARAFLAGGAP